jgi:ParB family chromosome partitioning protein
VVELIMEGKLSAGQARPLLALASAEEQITAARRIVDRGISSRGAEEIANANRTPRETPRAKPNLQVVAAADPNLAALADSVQRALKRKVRIIPRQGNTPGHLELDFYDDDDLTALTRILTVAGNAVSNNK